MIAATRQETLIACVARLLDGLRHVAVGASSPIPAAGAMLVRAQDEGAGREPLRISILGSVEHNFFTLHIKCMTRIWAALETGDNVIAGSKVVNNFSLSFIAPLQAKNYVNHLAKKFLHES